METPNPETSVTETEKKIRRILLRQQILFGKDSGILREDPACREGDIILTLFPSLFRISMYSLAVKSSLDEYQDWKL